MKGNDIDLTMDGYQEVIETTKILIKAGSEIGKRMDNTLWIFIYYSKTDEPCRYSALATKKYYQFIIELTEMLIKIGADLKCTQNRFTIQVISYASNVIDDYIQQNGDTEESDNNVDIFDAHMDGLRDLLGYCMVAIPGIIDSFDVDIYYNSRIMESLTKIAKYSSREGHSKKFIQLWLKVLTVTQVNRLAAILAWRLGNMTESTPDELRASTVSALKLVKDIETPYSLQHLARRAIIRAWSGRSLPSAAELKIPEHLCQYLAYK